MILVELKKPSICGNVQYCYTLVSVFVFFSNKIEDEFWLDKKKELRRVRRIRNLPKPKSILWCIWMENNTLIFKNISSDKWLLWDKIRHLTFIWCKAHGLLKGFPLKDVAGDWVALLHWCLCSLMFSFYFISMRIFYPPIPLYSSSLCLNEFLLLSKY